MRQVATAKLAVDRQFEQGARSRAQSIWSYVRIGLALSGFNHIVSARRKNVRQLEAGLGKQF
jgi:hypothetical protein